MDHFDRFVGEIERGGRVFSGGSWVRLVENMFCGRGVGAGEGGSAGFGSGVEGEEVGRGSFRSICGENREGWGCVFSEFLGSFGKKHVFGARGWRCGGCCEESCGEVYWGGIEVVGGQA